MTEGIGLWGDAKRHMLHARNGRVEHAAGFDDGGQLLFWDIGPYIGEDDALDGLRCPPAGCRRRLIHWL